MKECAAMPVPAGMVSAAASHPGTIWVAEPRAWIYPANTLWEDALPIYNLNEPGQGLTGR